MKRFIKKGVPLGNVPITVILCAMCLGSIAWAEQVEIEKEARKKEPRFQAEEKIYSRVDYEYSWIKQGPRKGNWRTQSNRIAYLNNSLQSPYVEYTIYERLGEKDYAIDLGSYFKLRNGYLHGAIGFGDDIDFIYKFKALIESEYKLIDTLFLNLNAKYLRYTPGDAYILSPGLVYYFGDNYASASYGASLTEGRDMAHFGMARGNFALNKYFNLWLGTAVGERLYDIFTLKASKQYGYILFAGTDVSLYKNIKLIIGGSYSKEQPSFIKRSIYFGASIKF